MKTTKKRKTRKKAQKPSILRRYWDKLKGWGEGLLNWLEWNTHTLWSIGLVLFGLAMLCPSIVPWTVIAWGALLVGVVRLLLDLKDRWKWL
jgi:hypothetical protein